MKRVPIGEVASIISGATPKTAVPEYWDGDIPWATPTDLSNLPDSQIHVTARSISQEGLRSCATSLLPPGSVLLSSRAPIGYVAINDLPMATNQGFKSLIPHEALDSRYLYHWLRANTDYLQSLGNGATFKELSRRTLERVLLPLPDTREQRRIAAILDHADGLRAKRRQALANLDTLTQSIFHDMFGDPSSALETIRFGDVANLVGGKNIVADDVNSRSRYRVLKISSVTSGTFEPHESKPLPTDYEPPNSHLVRKGDLLMSRANTAELVGAVALVDTDVQNLALPDKVWKFDWQQPASEPLFYWALFRSSEIRRRISKLASGTGGSMKNISKANLSRMRIPFHSHAQQAEFAARAWSIAQTRVRAVEAMRANEELFLSLQSRAFRGEL